MQSTTGLSSQQVGHAPLRTVVHGATGRMGSRLCELIHDDASFELVGALTHASSRSIGERASPGADDSPIVQNADSIDVLADVVIDFSRADAIASALACARRCKAAVLVGSTGLSDADMASIRAESAHRAVLIAPNTSLGVSAMVRIVSEATKMLGPGFGCAIVEAHHRGKRDAPSGTALRLKDAIEGAGAVVDDVHAIRAGDTIGEHVVRFDGPGETITITHRAVTRDLFVRGAMHAGAWLARQSAGLYTMEDVLGFAAR